MSSNIVRFFYCVDKNRNKKIRSVYYFSFMKLIVSTFLVYKVKKCSRNQEKSKQVRAKVAQYDGSYAHNYEYFCP